MKILITEHQMIDDLEFVCIHKHCCECNKAGVRGEKSPHVHTDCKCEKHYREYDYGFDVHDHPDLESDMIKQIITDIEETK